MYYHAYAFLFYYFILLKKQLSDDFSLHSAHTLYYVLHP